MALLGPQYEILSYTQELTEQGNLFYIERLLVECNTNGQSVTPRLTFDNDTTVDLASFSTTFRRFIQVDIERLGPLVDLALVNSNFAGSGIAFFSLELQLRPVQLGVNLIGIGSKVEIPGRSPDVSNALVFDINPFTLPEDARFITPIPRRLYIDIKTDSSGIQVELENDDGTLTNVGTFVSTTRSVLDLSILTGQRLRSVIIGGDFSGTDTILYDIELDTYTPGNRRLAVG